MRKDGSVDTRLLELEDFKKTGRLSAADEAKLCEAAKLLSAGKLVAFPTETVYGLGGNALLPDASERIYAAKGRPSDNPLIVHIADLKALSPLVEAVPERARALAERFWPGPLTMILKKADCVPYETTGGLDTVAVRMPEHPAARTLIRLSGVPVAAPSANTSGRPSPTAAEHVREDLFGKIEAIVDGGSAGIGVESTIIDLSGGKPVLLRPGAITLEMLQKALSEEVLLDPALEHPLDASVHPKAPGMKYRHYAPKAPMLIVEPASEDFSESGLMRAAEEIIRLSEDGIREGKRVGIICSEETMPVYQARLSVFCRRFGENAPKASAGIDGPAANTEPDSASADLGRVFLRSFGAHAEEASVAHNLFGILREMDERKIELILSEGVDPEQLGYAIMNRLKKAAGQNVRFV